MRFKDYFNLTKETTVNCLKICGVIFTSIYTVIAIITGFKNDSIVGAIEVFIICFLLGNGFGVFIWLLAISSAFSNYKNKTKFYNSIPENIRNEYGLTLVVKPQNPKFNFLELEILDTKSKHPFRFDYNKSEIWITIYNDLYLIDNFQKKMIEINKKYRREKIVLTGWGLRKIIKKRDWQLINEKRINNIFQELIEISKTENFKILERNFE